MAEYKTKVFTQLLEKPDQEFRLPVQTDMIVPDRKPDVGRILKTQARYDSAEKSLDESRLHFGGRIVCRILYAGEENERELHSLEHMIPVDDFMNVEIPEGEGRVRYWMDTEVIDTKTTILNSRKLNIQVVLKIRVSVIRSAGRNVVSEMEGISQLQVRRSKKETVQLCMDREEKYMVKEEIPVSDSAPNVEELLWWEVAVMAQEHRIMEGRASIQGELRVHILYRGEGSTEAAEYVEGRIPFQGLLDGEELRSGMPAKSDVKISDISVRITQDEDGEMRAFLVEAMVDCHLQAYEQKDLTVIDDMYAPGWEIVQKQLRCPVQTLFLKDSRKEKVTETLAIPEAFPGALQLFGAVLRPQVDATYIVDGTLHIEGVLHVQLFYLSSEDRYPIAAFTETVPFSAAPFSVSDGEEKQIDVRPVLLDASAELLQPRQVRLTAEIRFDALLFGSEEVMLTEDVSLRRKEEAELEKLPSLVVYVVQQQDDLWKIAKEFDTTPENVAELNHLEENRALIPGKQLLLMKTL